MATAPAIETRGLVKRFDSFTAVRDLSFDVREGEVFGLLGPNGAGKTTTIRMLACLISPTKGSATVGGYSIDKDPLKIREGVGILTENPSLYERLTASENMDFFAEAYGLTNGEEKARRIKELLGIFDLWGRRNDKVATFSRGMKQKLAIARALVHNPPILFLDEPTSGLDPESAKVIRDLIEELSRHEKHTVLLCTHRLEDADRLCDRVMIINGGRSVAIGTVDELRGRIQERPVVRIALRKIDGKIVTAVRGLERVREVEVDNSAAILKVTVNDYEEAAPEVVRSVVQTDGEILAVNVLRPSLEEAYLKLVKGV